MLSKTVQLIIKYFPPIIISIDNFRFNCAVPSHLWNISNHFLFLQLNFSREDLQYFMQKLIQAIQFSPILNYNVIKQLLLRILFGIFSSNPITGRNI